MLFSGRSVFEQETREQYGVVSEQLMCLFALQTMACTAAAHVFSQEARPGSTCPQLPLLQLIKDELATDVFKLLS